MFKALLMSISLSPSLFHHTLLSPGKCHFAVLSARRRVLLGFRPLCSAIDSACKVEDELEHPSKHLKNSMLLERLRIRHLKDALKSTKDSKFDSKASKVKKTVESFEELGLSEEVMGAVKQMGISVPTEIQSIGIPAALEGKDVVLGSHTGSGKTLAYLLPLVQMLRRDETLYGMPMKPRRPRAVVLCPTRELCEQVFHVAKAIGHHARFRSCLLSGGCRVKPQEDLLKSPVDMVVGTPGRVLEHIEEKNVVYGDIKYVVLDEADTMFDHGFGTDIRKFLKPLKNRSYNIGDFGYQVILAAATMTKGVQKLVDEEFNGIVHLRTSTLHKKIATARHDFIKIPGSEDKLTALLQVLEPSLAKGNRVMVFCNTMNSSRAVDYFLAEHNIPTANYHGDVPPHERVENLNKFKSEEGDCPTLVCTDLAARGLDLAVDHVIMFDFPPNSIDYLHRTGRTARMGAKGKVTSLVTKRDLLLARRIEEAMQGNQALDTFNKDNVRTDFLRARLVTQAPPNQKVRGRVPNPKTKTQVTARKGHMKSDTRKNTSTQKGSKRSSEKEDNANAPWRRKNKKESKFGPLPKASSSTKPVSDLRRPTSSGMSIKGQSKLSVVGFVGRKSASKKNESAISE